MADITAPDDRPDAPDEAHLPPEGVSDEAVAAVGKVTAALEVVEHARGLLYAFHRETGRADNALVEALEDLESAGFPELAEQVREDLVGRNVIAGRWTFQVVEDYDESYWSTFRDWERTVREEVVGGRRHVYESQMKERNRTHGRPGHESRPAEQGAPAGGAESDGAVSNGAVSGSGEGPTQV